MAFSRARKSMMGFFSAGARSFQRPDRSESESEVLRLERDRHRPGNVLADQARSSAGLQSLRRQWTKRRQLFGASHAFRSVNLPYPDKLDFLALVAFRSFSSSRRFHQLFCRLVDPSCSWLQVKPLNPYSFGCGLCCE